MTFGTKAAADAFAAEVQAGDVLTPGVERDFVAEQVAVECCCDCSDVRV